MLSARAGRTRRGPASARAAAPHATPKFRIRSHDFGVESRMCSRSIGCYRRFTPGREVGAPTGAEGLGPRRAASLMFMGRASLFLLVAGLE